MPRNAHWSPAALIELINAVEQTLRIDKDRVYLTGFSLGIRDMADRRRFSRRLCRDRPLCGMSDLAEVSRLRDIPVWAFHGAQDQNVPLSESQKMADALRSIGGHAG